jgi:hypothetical protein
MRHESVVREQGRGQGEIVDEFLAGTFVVFVCGGIGV